MPHDLERDLAPALSELHAAVGLVLDQPELRQLADHRRDRARRQPEALGELVRRDGAALALLQRVHGLGVVLDRRRN